MPTKKQLLNIITELKDELKPIHIKRQKKQLKGEGKQECTECQLIKPYDEFNLSNPSKSQTSRRCICKNCQKYKNSVYYQNAKKIMYDCDCQQSVAISNKYNHLKSKRHSKRLELLRH